MKKFAFNAIATIALAFGLAVASSSVAIDSAQAQNLKRNVCKGADLSLSGGGGNCDEGAGEGKLNNLIRQIVNIISVIVGIVAVIMIMYGGFRYITSGGDSGNVGTAKNIIIYALVGLIIVALAQIIVRFILGKLPG